MKSVVSGPSIKVTHMNSQCSGHVTRCAKTQARKYLRMERGSGNGVESLAEK